MEVLKNIRAIISEEILIDAINAVRQIAIENALGILEIQAADTLASGVSANMVRDVFSDATGYLNTIDTSNTTASFSSNKYMMGTVMQEYTEGHGINLSNLWTTSTSCGVKITPSKNISLKTVTKSSFSTATRCRVWLAASNGYSTLLGTASFSDNTATFSSAITLTSGQKYIIECDASGSNYNIYYETIQNVTETDFVWNNGSVVGSDSSDTAGNVVSITYEISTVPATVVVETNSQSLSFTPTHFQVFAYKKSTTGTGSITADVSFNGGTNYQTGIALDTPTEITNQGTNMILKINLNAGASSGTSECQGYGIMFWEE